MNIVPDICVYTILSGTTYLFTVQNVFIYSTEYVFIQHDGVINNLAIGILRLNTSLYHNEKST